MEPVTICFAERDARFKDPRIFQMLGLGHITAFAQVSFFYVPGREEWDAWLTPANELRDLEWLQQQPKGRRAVHLGGWFASDEFPEWHGNTAAKRMAFEIDGDGAVGLGDYFLFLDRYFHSYPSADVDGSGVVDTGDVYAFLEGWYS